MEDNDIYLQVDPQRYSKLMRGDYIKYKRSDNAEWKSGYVLKQWKKEVDGKKISGLVMSNRWENGIEWTVSFVIIEVIKKQVNRKFLIEFDYLLDRIKEIESNNL